MKTHIIPLLLLSALLAGACENEIPFNLKDNPPKLVMNALMNADSTRNVLYLNLTDRQTMVYVKDATVEVRVDGILTETLHAEPADDNHSLPNRYIIRSRFRPGETVRIDATTPDGAHHAWAEVVVPQPPQQIERVDTATLRMVNGYSSYRAPYMQYKISINDRRNQPDYYRLIVESINTKTVRTEEGADTTYAYKSYDIVSREDVVLTDGAPTSNDEESNGLFDKARNIYAVFDDARFRDNAYVMTVYNRIGEPYPELKALKTRTVIRLLSITETEFYYLKALNIIDSDAYDDTLMEPIKYPSNVHGGTGIVGISSETSYAIDIYDRKFE